MSQGIPGSVNQGSAGLPTPRPAGRFEGQRQSNRHMPILCVPFPPLFLSACSPFLPWQHLRSWTLPSTTQTPVLASSAPQLLAHASGRAARSPESRTYGPCAWTFSSRGSATGGGHTTRCRFTTLTSHICTIQFTPTPNIYLYEWTRTSGRKLG